MATMPDQIVWARIMTALDLEFERALHYHDEGDESDNDYGLPPHIRRPVCIYSVFSVEASFNLADYTTTQCQFSPFTPRHPKAFFNLADYTTTQCQFSPFTPRHPRDLPFQEGFCQCLTFEETLLPALSADSEDEEDYLYMAELDNPVWDEELVPDNREYLYIYEIPRPGTPPPHPQPIPLTLPLQPWPRTSRHTYEQPKQVEVFPELELMEQDVPDNIPDLIDVPRDTLLDFEAWAYDVLSYQF